MRQRSGPQPLAEALSELITLRGYGRTQGPAQLHAAWAGAAGEAIGRQTRAVAVKRGVLYVSVGNAPLLAQLSGYYRASLLEKFNGLAPHLRITGLKFRLDSGVSRGSQPPE
jgi:predicted nucleic acid-binding Zn ribbon protein